MRHKSPRANDDEPRTIDYLQTEEEAIIYSIYTHIKPKETSDFGGRIKIYMDLETPCVRAVFMRDTSCTMGNPPMAYNADLSYIIILTIQIDQELNSKHRFVSNGQIRMTHNLPTYFPGVGGAWPIAERITTSMQSSKRIALCDPKLFDEISDYTDESISGLAKLYAKTKQWADWSALKEST